MRRLMRFGTRARWAAALVIAALTGGCVAPAPAPPAETEPDSASAELRVPAGWRLVWADEFDRPGPPDPARWAHDTGRNREGWYNHELQYYSGPTGDNAVVRDGRLVITARLDTPRSQADWGGQRYTSARLITRGLAQWTTGFFEIRARMPCGKGTWPAIWLLGAGGRWPEDGELDILEHMGQSPQRVSSAVHTAAGSGGDAVGGKALIADACTAFHDYQMLWTHDAVHFGLDGRRTWTYRRPVGIPQAWPFDAPQFVILNLAIGGDLGGPVDDGIFPVSLEVEHVRVYQATPRPEGAPR